MGVCACNCCAYNMCMWLLSPPFVVVASCLTFPVPLPQRKPILTAWACWDEFLLYRHRMWVRNDGIQSFKLPRSEVTLLWQALMMCSWRLERSPLCVCRSDTMLSTIMRYWRYLPYEEKWFIETIALEILFMINGLCCFGSETWQLLVVRSTHSTS